jgi:FKBP-type peptidyl-prolyl cis-trans isomerase
MRKVLPLFFSAALLTSCVGVQTQQAASPAPAPTAEPAMAADSGLKIVDDVVGTGAVAEAGKTVSVNYTGWLLDGHKQFDSSYSRNQPFEFHLGAGEVIKGWDEGVVGMKVGGKRTLTIPASLGYGASGAGGGLIPGGATLVFDVELLEVK